MTARTVSARPWTTARSAVLQTMALVGLAVPGLAAQQPLPLKTAPPPGTVLICDDSAERSAAVVAGDADGASRLVNAATQAMLLGDLDGALEFLNRALLLDPSAAEAVYLRARILQRQGASDAAAAALCHYLRLNPASASAQEVRQRLDDARDAGAARSVMDIYRRALALEQEGRLGEAEAAFTEVLSARPAAAVARYNRAVIRFALGQDAAARADLVAYLELEPRASDADQVRQFLGPTTDYPARPRATATASARPRASTAFIIGALVPGGGQYYTGRPTLGAAVTAVAGGVVAAGILHRKTTIHCRDALAEVCPEDMISSRDTERPLLLPAIGAAAGLALVAALEAATRVSSDSGRHGASPPSAVGSTRLLPSGELQYDGSALWIELVRLNF
jgi:tetratricopeptide (TPR) repeat protein